MLWLCIALALCWPAAGRAVSGNTLLSWCEQHLRDPNSGDALSAARTSTGAACLGYVAAVVDTVGIAQAWKQWRINICVPADTPTVESARVYVAWARRHEQSLRRPAADALARALNEAFRCR